MYHVYLLKDDSSKLYLGYSRNLKLAMDQHLHGKIAATRRMNNPFLYYYESYDDEHIAKEREKDLKSYGQSYSDLLNRIQLHIV